MFAQTSPPPPPPRKRHILRWVLAGIGGFIVLIIVVALAAGGSKQPGATTAAPATTSPATAAPAAAPVATTAAPSPTTVTFYVSGTGQPSITYGSSSDNRDGGGTLGTLSDGNALPWHASIPFDSTASYYSINAQLEGDTGGNITCSIVVTGPGLQPLTVSHGHAQGGSNICSAQAAPTDTTGTNWQNES